MTLYWISVFRWLSQMSCTRAPRCFSSSSNYYHNTRLGGQVLMAHNVSCTSGYITTATLVEWPTHRLHLVQKSSRQPTQQTAWETVRKIHAFAFNPSPTLPVNVVRKPFPGQGLKITLHHNSQNLNWTVVLLLGSFTGNFYDMELFSTRNACVCASHRMTPEVTSRHVCYFRSYKHCDCLAAIGAYFGS